MPKPAARPARPKTPVASGTSAATPRRVYGGQSHDVRTAERRRAFLDAGIQVFGMQGYRAATVRMICAEAGLTDRYFYESFDDSEALLRAVYVELSNRLKAAAMDAVAQAGPSLEARADAGLEAFLQFMRDPRVARIMLMEVLGVSQAVTALYLSSSAEFAELLLGTADAFMPGLAGAREDRRALGSALVGALVYTAGGWALSGYARPLADVKKTCQVVLIGAAKQFVAELPRR